MKDCRFSLKPKASPLILRLRDFFLERRIESYIVGGYIRDCFLNINSTDIDIAVAYDAIPLAKQMADILHGKYVLLDRYNKIARIILPSFQLDLSSMRGTIEEDLSKRDFTINAMAVDLTHFENNSPVIDPFNGYNDLNDKMIRAVSSTSFEDDPIRLLRALRFAAEFDSDIDRSTELLISTHAHLANKVAGERIHEELCTIASMHNADCSLRNLDRLGILSHLIPELTAGKSISQPKEHFWDVFDHSIETMAAVERLFAAATIEDELLGTIPWSPRIADYFNEEISNGHCRKTMLKLAALLHDIGKPATKTVDETGRIRFIGHAQEGAIMAKNILERFRFSNREIHIIVQVITHHMRPGQLGDEAMPSRKAIYRYFRDTGDTGLDILFFSLIDHLAARGPLLVETHWHNHIKLVEYVILKHTEEQNFVKPPKLIDGHDLISLGASPGPTIGIILETIREAQASGEIVKRTQALALAKRLLD